MKIIKTCFLLFVTLWIISGVIYPLFVTAISRIIFPYQAHGSLIHDDTGKATGSELIGQPFLDSEYFWSRPSATAEFPYNPLASGGSNLGPTNNELKNQISEREKKLRESGIDGAIPSDLIMASASGLDPHISLEAALLQVPRVAKARGLNAETINKLVFANLEDQFGFLGHTRVNVLKLNMELNKLGDKTND